MKTCNTIIHLIARRNSQNICSWFMSWTYQPKIKCKDGASYFYKNQKYRRLAVGNRNKFFSVISFEKFLIFPYGLFKKCSMFRRSIPLISKNEAIHLLKIVDFTEKSRTL